jgi:dinuclear metal center YbgI/SA1388 family protein
MQLREIIDFLEKKAPLSLQESYDNSGLIVGNPSMDIKGAIICLDSLEAIVDEAIEAGFNLVIAHHPIVFSGLKKIIGKNYIERTLLKAIKNDIAIYAIHTNLDNVHVGVNRKISEKIGLQNIRILDPKSGNLHHLVVYVPSDHAEQVREALFASGAGAIGNYSECSFNQNGVGTFKPELGANPFAGVVGTREEKDEVRIEVLVQSWQLHQVLQAMKAAHPYEEVAHHHHPISNVHQEIGSGMIGELKEPMSIDHFLQHIKKAMNAQGIRYTKPHKKEIQKVALCGGSGSFLLNKAKSEKADIFITADYKYHQFFDAEDQIIIADIGHFESEQYTIDLISDWLAEKFPTFATRKPRVVTNPINYL